MDVKSLAKSLGITQQHVLGKANELIRLLKLKQPGSLGQGEICRPAVCLELACQTTPGSRLPVRDEFIRFSCSPPKVYNEMFTRIQRLLDVRPALDLRELVTIFGCLQLRPAVEQLLRAYKSRFLTSLPAEERARADLTRPAFLAGAFLLAAKKHKAKVDRAALTNKMGLTRGELEGALKDMAARCADMLQPQQAAEGGEGAGRKRARGDTAGEEQAADGPAKALGAATGRGGATKRPRRGAAAGAEAEGEDGEAAVSVAAAHDVAVEDLRLVLCGIRPAAAPAAAAGSQDEGEAEAEVERPKSRKKLKTVGKGSRTEGGGDRNEGAALGNGEEEEAVVVMAAAKKGKLKKSRRPQAEEQVPEQGREGQGQELVAGAV